MSSLYQHWLMAVMGVFFLTRYRHCASQRSLAVGLASCQKAAFTQFKGIKNMATESNGSDVVKGLETMINSTLGASESASTKTRLHAIGCILGSLSDEFAPILERKFNVNALFDAIQRLENGIAETEGGVRDLLAVIEHKTPDTTTTSQLG